MTSSMIGKGSLAVGLMLTMAASAGAQQRDTTRAGTDTLRATSTQRIPVTKESSARRTQTSGGEVRLSRDSAMIRDSIARRDSIVRDSVARRDSIVRDSVARRDRSYSPRCTLALSSV